MLKGNGITGNKRRNAAGESKRVALYVDFANVWATAKSNGQEIDTSDFIRKAKGIGEVITSKIYLPVKVGERVHGNILSFEREGYKVISRFVPNTEFGEKKDIDTYLVTDFIVDLFTLDLDVMVLVSDDSDFSPALKIATERGVEVISFVSNSEHAKVVANSSGRCYEIGSLYELSAREKVHEATLEVFQNPLGGST